MKKIYVVTVNIAVVAESENEVYDAISAGLTENLEISGAILDWQYTKSGEINIVTDKGEYNSDNYEEGQAFVPKPRKTHIVIDEVYTEEEGNQAFAGTQQQCLDFVSEQGFGYKVVPMTPEEIKIHNNEN